MQSEVYLEIWSSVLFIISLKTLYRRVYTSIYAYMHAITLSPIQVEEISLFLHTQHLRTYIQQTLKLSNNTYNFITNIMKSTNKCLL